MFDPYHIWLGIPPKDQPPNHYRLLGIELYESHADVIDAAATRQSAYLQNVATGEHRADSQRLLTEIAAARRCLLDQKSKAAYDAQLRMALPGDIRSTESRAEVFPVLDTPHAAASGAIDTRFPSKSATAPRLAGPRTRSKQAGFPWSTVIAGVFAVILFIVWWNLRGGDDAQEQRTLDADEQTELIEQEQATDPNRSFFSD